MLKSLNSAVSGLQYQQNRLDVIGNNISNINTVGYRAGRTNAADSFSQVLSERSQIGTGVKLAGVTNTFSQGLINGTGQPYDMAIEGNGFFLVKNSAGETFATRAGDFRLDKTGFLVTQDGMKVQGLDGDISINLGVDGVSWQIQEDGKIMLSRGPAADGKPQDPKPLGQIKVQNFSDLGLLSKVGGNRFGTLAAAGPEAEGAPGSAGRGVLRWQSLESSNVDLASQFTDLIVTQRAYQANSKIITTSDEILQELINLKR